MVDDCFRGHFSDNDEYIPLVHPKNCTLNMVDKRSGAMLWAFAASSSGCPKRFRGSSRRSRSLDEMEKSVAETTDERVVVL